MGRGTRWIASGPRRETVQDGGGEIFPPRAERASARRTSPRPLPPARERGVCAALNHRRARQSRIQSTVHRPHADRRSTSLATLGLTVSVSQVHRSRRLCVRATHATRQGQIFNVLSAGSATHMCMFVYRDVWCGRGGRGTLGIGDGRALRSRLLSCALFSYFLSGPASLGSGSRVCPVRG